MGSENGARTADKVEPIKDAGGKRQRSSIAFPYLALDEAIKVATAIHNNQGTGACTRDQLAAWLKLSAKSSGFRTRLSATELFGLITENGDTVQLTELGRMIIDAKREREARSKSFLSVPLFRAVYEKYKGGVVPPAAAVENELVALGVAQTLKGTARSVLERSADAAGFYATGRDRLVMPGIKGEGVSPTPKPEVGGGGGGDGGDGDEPTSGIPLAIEVLMNTLPEEGDLWPRNQRERWLQQLNKAFDKLYLPD